MTHYNLALVGFGNVGRAFARLLERKQDELSATYGITYTITAIATGRHGSAIHPQGIPGAQAAAHVEAGGSLRDFSATPAPADRIKLIRTCGADVLFENTPVNYETGQPAVDHIAAALRAGTACSQMTP